MAELLWTGGDGQQVPLNDEWGVLAIDGTSGFDGPPVASELSDRMGDGATRVASRRGVRQLMLALLFTDEQTEEDLMSSFLATTASATAPLGTITQMDGNGRELTQVVYVGGLESDGGRNSAGEFWTKRVVELHAVDPYWYGPSRTVALPVAKETAYDDAGIVYSSATTPYDGGGLYPLSIEGSEDPDGVVTLTGPITRFSFGSVEGLWTLADPLAGGDVVTVDTRVGSRGPRRAGVLDWTLLDRNSTLHPVSRSGQVIVGATSTAGAAATFTYRPRYALR